MENEFPLRDLLNQYRILLGSKSPRRKELLAQLDIPFEVINITGVKEVYPDTILPPMVPQYLSNLKFNGYRNQLQDNELLITADTVVISDNEILGKPHSEQEACAMLRRLANHTHTVVTGVTLGTHGRQKGFSASSKVTFGPLSPKEIEYYVTKYKPLDKAGAYGIQEWIGCVAVEGIEGSFYNVMGLPVYRLFRELQHFSY